MASGSFNGAFSGRNHHYPRIEWSSTTNVANNTSSVTAKLYFVRTSQYSYNANGSSMTLKINNSSQTATKTHNTQSNAKPLIWERTVTVPHNADGSKSITISASGATGTSLGSFSFSGTAKLDTIPRASSLGSFTSSINFGSSVTFPISRASSSFTHTINCHIEGFKVVVADKTTSTSVSWTPSHDLSTKIPTKTSVKATIFLDTYSGSTKIGTNIYYITLNVPNNSTYQPSIGSLTATESNSTVSGMSLGSNTFLQGKSSIAIASSDSAKYGATITQRVISIGGFTSLNSSSGTINLSGYTTQVGTGKSITMTVTDSRGFTATKTISFGISAYTAPKISSFTANRTTGTNVQFTKSTSFTAVGNNALTHSLTYTGGSSGSVSGLDNATNTKTQSGFDTAKSYTFTYKITDKFGSTTSMATIATDKVPISLNRDIGVGIMKVHEGKAALEVGGDILLPTGSTLMGGAGHMNQYIPAGDVNQDTFWKSSIFPNGISLWYTNKTNSTYVNHLSEWGYVLIMKNGSEVTVSWYARANGGVWRTGMNSSASTLVWKRLDNEGVLNQYYPVGTIYESTNSANPSTFMGGTWERFGNGRVTVGVNESDSDFNGANKTGGEKAHVLTVAEQPPVTGSMQFHGSGSGTQLAGAVGALSVSGVIRGKYLPGGGGTGANSGLNAVFNNGGAGTAHNNMPPYVTVYRWRRTA